MLMRFFLCPAAALGLLLATACSPSTDSTHATGPAVAKTDASPAAPAADEGQPAAGENVGTIHLVVSGGPHAGTYDAVMHEGGASYGLAGEHVFGNQYSENGKKANELSSVQLTIDDVKGDKTTTSGFTTAVTFGPLLGGDVLNLNTERDASRPEGKGQVSLTYGGGRGPATVKLAGETSAHEKIDLTIKATQVENGQ